MREEELHSFYYNMMLKRRVRKRILDLWSVVELHDSLFRLQKITTLSELTGSRITYNGLLEFEIGSSL